jgi:hypothetical protein
MLEKGSITPRLAHQAKIHQSPSSAAVHLFRERKAKYLAEYFQGNAPHGRYGPKSLSQLTFSFP